LVIGYAVGYIGAATGTGLLIRRYPLPLWGASDYLDDFWYSIVFKLLLLLLLPLYAFWRLGYGADDVLFGWRPRLKPAFTVALAFLSGCVLNLDRLEPMGNVVGALPPSEATQRIAMGAALALLTAGFPEEFFFRGLLQTRLEFAFGRLIAIMGTVLLFTAWHLPTRYLLSHGVEGEAGQLGSVLLGTGIPVFVVGLGFGLGWDRYRNLAVLVAMHWGIDLLPTVGSLLQIPPK